MDVAIELMLEAVKTLTPSRETLQRVIADPPFAEHATANGDTTVPLLIGLVHDKVTEASARPTINRHNAKLSALTNLNIASPSSGQPSAAAEFIRLGECQPIRLQWSGPFSGE